QGFGRLYQPDFQNAVDQAIHSQVDLLSGNRNLIGYFLDSDLDWNSETFGVAHYFDWLTLDDPNRAQVMSVVRSLWNSPQAFSADWGSSIKSFDDLKTLPRTPARLYARLNSAWLSHLSRDYFQLVSSRIRYYDPNHLIFGVRYSTPPPPEAVRAA